MTRRKFAEWLVLLPYIREFEKYAKGGASIDRSFTEFLMDLINEQVKEDTLLLWPSLSQNPFIHVEGK